MRLQGYRRAAATTLLLAALGAAGCGETPIGNNIIPGDTLTTSFSEVFATYLGGSGEESIRDAAVDAQGNLYVTGATQSGNFPSTAGAFGTSLHANGAMTMDAFVTKYDPSGHVLWSTYLGGPEYDRAYAMEVDEQGYVYVAGRAGAGFPVTPGALQTTFAGGTLPDGAYGPQDGFLCKLRPDGTGVVFCTYLGTANAEIIRDLAIDANHNIYVTTTTSAANPYPAAWFANAYQKTARGGLDVVVVKIRSDGSAVDWATLLGGTGEETNGTSVRVDGSGVYVDFTTRSSDIPTPNGFDHTLGGPADAYLGKLSLDGSQLLYGTYVGGSGDEGTETHHLAIDGSGNAIVALGSGSTDFPTTSTAVQKAPGGGIGDVLVVKVSPSGALLAATYFGGSGNESAEGVATDSQGNIYFAGGTGSADFPVTGGPGAGGGPDGIAVGLTSDLSHVLFSQRQGGSGEDPGRAIAVGSTRLVVAGQTTSPNFPVMNAPQAQNGGGLDGFLLVFKRGS